MAKKKISKFAEALLEMADDMHRIGILDAAAHRQISIRHLGYPPVPTAHPISGDEIRSLREQAQVSQAVFASYLT